MCIGVLASRAVSINSVLKNTTAVSASMLENLSATEVYIKLLSLLRKAVQYLE